MSDKSPATKGLTIEIEDLDNAEHCLAAIRKLFGALSERHGRQRTSLAWYYLYDYPAVMEFEAACAAFVPDELRLVLEYYAMAKPSKRGLAKELARRNETLRPKETYGPNGSTDEDTMHQQIKRIFRRYKGACRFIGMASPELRQEKLQSTDHLLRMEADDWARGERERQVGHQGDAAGGLGHKSK
jgi:hypothetical protein